MWAVIDQEMDRLMVMEGFPTDFAASRGFCLGAATMLAVFLNCYRPDVDAIRIQAVARWHERNPDG